MQPPFGAGDQDQAIVVVIIIAIGEALVMIGTDWGYVSTVPYRQDLCLREVVAPALAARADADTPSERGRELSGV